MKMAESMLRGTGWLLLAILVLISMVVWGLVGRDPEPKLESMPSGSLAHEASTPHETGAPPLPALERYEGASQYVGDSANDDLKVDVRELRGLLVMADGSSVPTGCRVLVLRDPTPGSAASSPQRIETPVDARGEFTFVLPDDWRLGEFVPVRVIDALGGIPFDGFVYLTASVYLELAPRHHLHGRVTATHGSPFAGASVTLRHRLRGSGNWANSFIAPAVTDPDGRFQMTKYLSKDLLPEEYVADVALSGNEGFAAIAVRHDDLVSFDGAILTLALARLTVAVRHDDEPVPGAALRCSALAWGQQTGTWLSRKSDESGHASFLLPANARAELSVVAPGHAPWFGRVPAEDMTIAHTLVVHLVDLENTRRLAGRVLGPDSRPLADAYLSAWRETELPEVGAGSMVHATSDEAGYFVLEIPDSMFPCRLVSSHPVHGLSSELRIVEPVQGDLEIVHRLRRDVVVEVRSFVTATPFTSGPMHAFVVDRVEGHAGSYALRGPPFRLRGIAAGSYNLALCSAGGRAYGHASFEVNGSAPEVVVPIDLGLTMKASGHVQAADGTPLNEVTVRLLHSDWPGARPPWTACRTSHGGWFDVVPGSLAEQHQAEVVSDGRVLWSGSIEQGDANVIVVGR